VIQWCLRARWDAESLEQIVDRALLSQNELAELRAAQDFLWTVRHRLHLSAGRRHDRVTYEDQDAIAAVLGYRDGMTLAVEQYLQTHYRHARAIARVVDSVGDRVRRSLRPRPTTVRDLGGGQHVHHPRETKKHNEHAHKPPAANNLYK
jgi:[protein-PII] uridylyltransferase